MDSSLSFKICSNILISFLCLSVSGMVWGQDAILVGQFSIVRGNYKIKAQEGFIHNGIIEAKGNIKLDWIRQNETVHLKASKIKIIDGPVPYGEALDVVMEYGNYHISASKVIIQGENQWLFEGGMFSSCDGDQPAWSFVFHQADIEIGGFAVFRHLVFKAKNIPLIVLPIFAYPAQMKRKTGFLPPMITQNSHFGWGLNIPLFITLGEHQDLMLETDVYTGHGATIRAEHRFANKVGQFWNISTQYYDWNEADEQKTSWEYRGDMSWATSENSRFFADINWVTDPQALQRFSPSYNRYSRRQSDWQLGWNQNSSYMGTSITTGRVNRFYTGDKEDLDQEYTPQLVHWGFKQLGDHWSLNWRMRLGQYKWQPVVDSFQSYHGQVQLSQKFATSIGVFQLAEIGQWNRFKTKDMVDFSQTDNPNEVNQGFDLDATIFTMAVKWQPPGLTFTPEDTSKSSWLLQPQVEAYWRSENAEITPLHIDPWDRFLQSERIIDVSINLLRYSNAGSFSGFRLSQQWAEDSSTKLLQRNPLRLSWIWQSDSWIKNVEVGALWNVGRTDGLQFVFMRTGWTIGKTKNFVRVSWAQPESESLDVSFPTSKSLQWSTSIDLIRNWRLKWYADYSLDDSTFRYQELNLSGRFSCYGLAFQWRRLHDNTNDYGIFLTLDDLGQLPLWGRKDN